MKEIGSFIELELPKGREYYSDEINVARLNSGRAAIYHACKVLGVSNLWIPYYQCESVREFLIRKNISLKFYEIDSSFRPLGLEVSEDEAVLFVNYFGIFSQEQMSSLSAGYSKVVIDNSQAFFASPLPHALNVYSPRKFLGVPDGGYLIGDRAHLYTDSYPQSYSSDTASFLMERMEYGCEGKAYTSRQKNEERIDKEDVMQMSILTRTLLDSIDYDSVIQRRRENFHRAKVLFDEGNLLSVLVDEKCVPMVYPLLKEDDALLDYMLSHKHFQGRWWRYLIEERPSNTFEYRMSRYLLPITIDQRYNSTDIEYIYHLITNKNE